MKIYHASPDYIESFDFSYGVHFGGIFSAYEAGLRKLSNLQKYKDVVQDHIFVHVCVLDTSAELYKSIDVGSKEEWDKEIQKAKALGFKGIVYKNLYEPDLVSSYLIFDSTLITIEYIDPIDSEEAERLLSWEE